MLQRDIFLRFKVHQEIGKTVNLSSSTKSTCFYLSWLTFFLVTLIINIIGCDRTFEEQGNKEQRDIGGHKQMERNYLIEALNRVDSTKRAEMDSLIELLANESRETARAAVALWVESDAIRASKAASLLIGFGDLAIIPLLEAPNPPNSSQRVWLLRAVVEAELDLRGLIVARLDRMLDDKSPVPLPEDQGPIEEEPPPRRVCDESYVLMRKLVNFTESPEKYYMNVEAFLNLTNDEKDAEILKTRESHIWTQLIEDIEGQTELE
jgi:hypothetical protein